MRSFWGSSVLITRAESREAEAPSFRRCNRLAGCSRPLPCYYLLLLFRRMLLIFTNMCHLSYLMTWWRGPWTQQLPKRCLQLPRSYTWPLGTRILELDRRRISWSYVCHSFSHCFVGEKLVHLISTRDRWGLVVNGKVDMKSIILRRLCCLA